MKISILASVNRRKFDLFDFVCFANEFGPPRHNHRPEFERFPIFHFGQPYEWPCYHHYLERIDRHDVAVVNERLLRDLAWNQRNER